MSGEPPSRLLLYAPNIHVGGGLELLKDLLCVCSSSFDVLLLDERIRGHFALPQGADVYWVKRTIAARLCAERQLERRCSPGDTVLCFHGLPPLFSLRGVVTVFVQNRILFESGMLAGYSTLTRIRLYIERVWMHMMRSHADRYFVQTASMAALVRRCLGYDICVCVKPFAPLSDSAWLENNPARVVAKSEFVYVASGEPHKNHANLLEAWRLLAEGGLRPTLTVTVSPDSYPSLSNDITRYAREFDLQIINVGHVARDYVHKLYQSSSALIFASKLESFGLPLIEASQLGLPVLAPELDYVRDVIQPSETFDPSSPLSIARAVKRFLHKLEPAAPIGSAEEFLAEVRK